MQIKVIKCSQEQFSCNAINIYNNKIFNCLKFAHNKKNFSENDIKKTSKRLKS